MPTDTARALRRPAMSLLHRLGRSAARRPGRWGRRPAVLMTVDATTLGVHAPVRTHTDRPVDARVEALVGAEPVVVATGPRLAGTTHALARAARLLLGDHTLLRPSGPGDVADSVALAALLARAADDHGGAVVVWVDDAPRAVVRALADGIGPPDGVRLLVTVREELLHADVAAGDLGGALLVRVPGALPGPSGPARREDLDALGQLFCPLPRHDDPRDEAPVESVPRAAVLRAAVWRAVADWDRLAVGLPLTRTTLALLAADHARALDPRGGAHEPDELARVVDALAARPDALLRRVRWDDRGPEVHHVADPRLAAVADDLVPTAAGWTAPPCLVEELDARLTDRDDRRAVGVLALHRRCDDAALRLLGDADPTALSAASAYGVGLTALEGGHPEQARRWFTALADADPGADGPDRAAEPGYRARAAFWLGLDPETGPDERRARFSLVVSEGSAVDRADAASMLAALERGAGRADARRHWLRAAVAAARESGDSRRCADALVELAHLDWTAGDVDAARAAFTEAAASGDVECGAEAMMALGTLAAEEGDEETARSWSRRAGTAACNPDPDPDLDVPRPRAGESKIAGRSSSTRPRRDQIVT